MSGTVNLPEELCWLIGAAVLSDLLINLYLALRRRVAGAPRECFLTPRLGDIVRYRPPLRTQGRTQRPELPAIIIAVHGPGDRPLLDLACFCNENTQGAAHQCNRVSHSAGEEPNSWRR
jgi:hypothetical protein